MLNDIKYNSMMEYFETRLNDGITLTVGCSVGFIYTSLSIPVWFGDLSV